jgi:hypothetical protein
MLVIVAAVVAVSAEKHGNHRTVPSYRSGSGSYEKKYEATTYANPTYNTAASYQYQGTETTYEDEPVYTKSYSRPSYKTTPAPYVTESASYYSKSSYEPSTYSSPSSTYVTSKPKSYEATEPVRSYSSKPTYSESPYSSPVYTTTTSAPYTTNQRYSTPAYYSKQDSYDYVRLVLSKWFNSTDIVYNIV